MSAAGDLIRELTGAGASYRQIGRSLGRNDSLIRQVGLGGKPGDNLEGPLRVLAGEFRARAEAGLPVRRGEVLEVGRPVARVTRGGEEAKVRKGTIVGQGRGYQTGRAGKQASQHGATSLGAALRNAARAGQAVAFDVTFKKGPASDAIAAQVNDNYANKKRRPVDWVPPGGHARGAVVAGTGKLDADELAAALEEHEGNLTNALLEVLGLEAGGDAQEQVIGIEMRAWTE